jgi:hypothetical protein
MLPLTPAVFHILLALADGERMVTPSCLGEQVHDPSEAGMMSTQRVLRAICSIYGLMLLAYPDDFRSRYGREMLLALRNRAHDAWRAEVALTSSPSSFTFPLIG